MEKPRFECYMNHSSGCCSDNTVWGTLDEVMNATRRFEQYLRGEDDTVGNSS